MDRELENACLRHGWDLLYERHIADLSPANSRGERDAKSPFPFSHDTQASFRVNTRSGVWIDWHAERLAGMKGGNYVQFLALLMSPVDGAGKPTNIDFKAAERWLRINLGLTKPVEQAWHAQCQAFLASRFGDVEKLWAGRKPWNRETMIALGVGFDQRTGRLTFPCYSVDGELVNVKMYSPVKGTQPKTYWHVVGAADNYLWPREARSDNWHLLAEGETDAITLRSIGFAGVSGTMGSGQPCPGGEWWLGKDVFVLMDSDDAGREAGEKALHIVKHGAARAILCELPKWDGAPANADVSDWASHLVAGGQTVEQVQAALRAVLTSGRLVATPAAIFDMKAVEVPFGGALTAANSRVKIAFSAHIAARSSSKYAAPNNVDATCPMTGHPFCKGCKMRTEWNGAHKIEIDMRSNAVLKMIDATDMSQRIEILKYAGIPQACPSVNLVVTKSVDIIPLMLTSPTTKTGELMSRDRVESYFVQSNCATVEDGTDNRFVGYVWPTPKTQRQALLLESATRLTSDIDSFEMDRATWDTLGAFRPPGDLFDWLGEVADDLASSFTGIRNRRDLHMMYRTVWNGLTSFQFCGSVTERGWIEMLLIGDTRTGKSKTFLRLKDKVYMTGDYVDAKSTTVPGLMGSVETSTITGERYVIPGIFPQHDRRGPVFVDEFTSTKYDRRSIMDHLSSMRSEGVVNITKAASAKFMARVPKIFSANPGQGRQMSDMGFYGCELIERLISQPEDVARFDVAMAVSHGEVDADSINVTLEPTEPRWTPAQHRLLLMWAWSRKPEDVVWADGAEDAVIECAKWMYRRYDASIPVVESSDQRTRVAKLAVSVAAQCFSTIDGVKLIVRPEHVNAAAQLFVMCYDKRSFGYDNYSIKAASERLIADADGVVDHLQKVFGLKLFGFAELLIKLHEFSESQLAMTVQTSVMQLRPTMQMLGSNRCIRPVRGSWKEMWELTPAFVDLLKGVLRGDYG